MAIANVGSKWSGGKIVFYNKVTGAEILTIDPDGDIELTAGQHIKGQRFAAQYPQVAAADVAKTFFIAKDACKVISVEERHVTVAGQACKLTVEKLTTGEAPGAGDDLLTTGLDLTSAANTTQTENAVTTAAATLAAGDALCLKVKSGNAASYALGTVIVTLEWL
jgi:hypothetical protein